MLIAATGTALPPHRYEQDELVAFAISRWQKGHHNSRRVEQLYHSVQVGGRNLSLPLEEYNRLSFGRANDAFIEVGTQLGERAIRTALASAGLTPEGVDAIFFTTVTGVAAPTIDARLVNRLGLRPDVKRWPFFGLGCVAGAAGIARMSDYLRAWPDQVAVLLSVELCSLTAQVEDLSIANFIATGLFGDGAAAVVGVGAERAARMGRSGPAVVATRSRFYPNTERVMGWDIGDSGFRIVLAPTVPDMVSQHMRQDVSGFLADHGFQIDEIGTWICHPGGPRVLEAFQSSLDLPEGALALTWRSLSEVGNLSSSSVLFVLQDTLAERPPAPGSPALMLAMGPGFCSELVLLRG
jgi:alkylresorcinol/alkylpyrone synthase